MEKMKKTLLLIIIFISVNNLLSAQIKDSIGVRIEEREFRCLVIYQLTKLNQDTISIDDAVIIARLFNTVSFDKELRLSNSLYGDFYEKIVETNLKVFSNLFDPKANRGIPYYSEKYNIYLGGRPRNDSQYFIVPIRH